MNSNNSPMSIASLVCGIISTFILPLNFGIASIILGIIGIARNEEKKKYSIAGIVIGIISLLWAFVLIGIKK